MGELSLKKFMSVEVLGSMLITLVAVVGSYTKLVQGQELQGKEIQEIKQDVEQKTKETNERHEELTEQVVKIDKQLAVAVAEQKHIKQGVEDIKKAQEEILRLLQQRPD